MTQCDSGDMLVLPDGIGIRMMRASDMPQVRALHTKLLPIAYPTAFFVQLLVQPQHMCVIATYDGNVVAFASALMETRHSTPGALGSCGVQDRPSGGGALRVTLLTLGVSPEFQRQGIARRLVHEVVQRLRSSCGVPSPCHETSPAPSLSESESTDAVILRAEVARNNSSGQSFYYHLGMKRQAEAEKQSSFGSKAHTWTR
ncbi:acyl-CoA N-acyltransferase [Suillus clintonianus]|uniref:acyl-CoA N-acyltransferase n=1 Tax=Suillus clintonianus TaxID=1904413 RepID=UPI001B86DAE8|nr:acyl-CoA N-acyltransferase [Suillus clintonianus]KAG2118475.1 acyl-CoA N-acyltransferase [Suillus clintonianus]